MSDLQLLLGRRARVVRQLRAFFDRRRFLEVDTPIAIAAPAPEAYIDPPAVTFRARGRSLPRALQASCELGMKRLLAAGAGPIYQIAPAFRDDDHSPLHRPEFRLLEWYRPHGTPAQVQRDTEALVVAAARAAGGDGRWLQWGGRRVELARPWPQVSLPAAFSAHLDLPLLDHLTVPSLAAALAARGIHHSPLDSWEDLFHRAFCGHIEPQLAASPRPLWLTDFPLPLASLARRHPRDPRLAERFELMVAGCELANGFGELTDPDEQRARFLADAGRRAATGRRRWPLDERFLAALGNMPPTVGIALGLERLLMLVMGAENIDAVSALPWDEA